MVETMRMFLAIHEGKLPISIANQEVARKRLLAQDNIGIIPSYASLHRSNQHFNQDEDVFDVMHYDDLKRWAAHNGHDKTKVDQAVNNSFDLQIIKDLSNNDKHGYPPRNCGYSGKCPKLIAINRVMQLKTQAKKNSTIGMTLSAQGIPMIFGDGTAKAIITGDVLDNDNYPDT